ncbi:MAG: plasmid pRiA4b ORF-3 family protein [Gammaproteobacteria bacterium]|nr:plasmid pRiA4b ORF-3 family protein [Gammaproteobacteria bacterium]MCB1850259.1 plasmid pRiA4b ORF-3 family protein [Gammaproteobacteria bacterium]
MQSSFRPTHLPSAANPPRNLRDLYQLKVLLLHVEPPIWRRLLVSNSIDLAMLHRIIQLVMGWSNKHSHQFTASGKEYGVPDDGFGNEISSEQGIRIGSLLKSVGQWIGYEYDFGDAWEHRILLEKILPFKPGEAGPECIDGRRSAPPEDVGGVWGYREFLEAFTDRGHADHFETVAWVNKSFNPERFDIADVNRQLKTMRNTSH